MRIEIEISQEILAAVMDGKCMEGRLRLQLSSMGTHQVIAFAPYNRKPKGSQDRVICQLENGWLKESPRVLHLSEEGTGTTYGGRGDAPRFESGHERDGDSGDFG